MIQDFTVSIIFIFYLNSIPQNWSFTPLHQSDFLHTKLILKYNFFLTYKIRKIMLNYLIFTACEKVSLFKIMCENRAHLNI